MMSQIIASRYGTNDEYDLEIFDDEGKCVVEVKELLCKSSVWRAFRELREKGYHCLDEDNLVWAEMPGVKQLAKAIKQMISEIPGVEMAAEETPSGCYDLTYEGKGYAAVLFVAEKKGRPNDPH